MIHKLIEDDVTSDLYSCRIFYVMMRRRLVKINLYTDFMVDDDGDVSNTSINRGEAKDMRTPHATFGLYAGLF
jgi:hypothetical protein